MLANVTMLTYGRPKLTEQAIRSFEQHTQDATLTTLDDGTCGTGVARNKVISAVGERGKYLTLSDNDVFFLPNWLSILIAAYEAVKPLGFKVLGGYSHPYNRVSRTFPVFCGNKTIEVGELHALGLQSMLMEWETWDQYGPFDETPIGRVRMSEDFAFCQKIRADGGKCGVVLPHVVLNTSITDTLGEPVPGAELIPRLEGVIME